ncbi:MAG: hypothetical protein C4K58_06535 [Flavobacteriaceae bacterium]|nr:MAG: hypothetical protein C4K58_06535 [Flavobacteriaceae bacterium]
MKKTKKEIKQKFHKPYSITLKIQPMKKNIFTLSLATLATVFALQSCQNSDSDNLSSQTTTQTSTQSDTAAREVLDFLQISQSSSDTLTSTSDTLKHHRGHHNITQIDIATLPEAITSYISTNYAGSTINLAGTDESGNYLVKITKADATQTGLLFDASGNFVSERAKKMHNHGTEIDSATLPEITKTYITTNYGTATIHKAIQETDGSYRVILVLTDGSYVGLSFDSTGNFVALATVKDKKGNKKGKGRH